MRIGQLALHTGTSAATIRYYEQIGLLPVPKRLRSNQRRYGKADVARLGFIRRCRALGFSLEQVRQFTKIAQAGGGTTDHCRRIVQARLVAVRTRIEEMKAVEARLAGLLADGAERSGQETARCERLAVLR